MTRKQGAESLRMPEYSPIIVSYGAECRFESFGPVPDSGRNLFEAGIQGMGIDRLHGRFKGGTGCSRTHLLYAVVEGEIWCDSSDGPRKLRAGDMLVAPARGPHRLRLGKAPCTAVWFHLKQYPRWDRLLEAGHHIQPVAGVDEWEWAMKSFLKASRSGTIWGRQQAFHHGEILLLFLDMELEDLRRPADREIRRRLLGIWDKVRDDPARGWTVRDLAKGAGLAPGYLHEVCRKQFGVTPMQRVTQVRMDEARRLLVTTNLPLAEIAARIGYRTEYAFSDAFKRMTGIRPGALRRHGT